jgi:hypothetical protein
MPKWPTVRSHQHQAHSMNLSEKYDALLKHFMMLKDENKALRETIAAVYACATPKEQKDLGEISGSAQGRHENQ